MIRESPRCEKEESFVKNPPGGKSHVTGGGRHRLYARNTLRGNTSHNWSVRKGPERKKKKNLSFLGALFSSAV